MARKAQQSRKARAKRVQARAPRKVSRRASPIPKGMHTVTPNLVLKDSAQAIEFYGKAFGAKELSRMPSPDGKGIWHAELKIGDSVIYLNDESPQGTCVAPSAEHKATASVHLYVRDSDALFDRAVKAGATVVMPMQDMFWGDRMGMVIDPFGNSWTIATHQRDLTRAQLRKAADEFSQRMAAGNEGMEAPEISPEVVG
jgi:PhnB protein